jgi:hypothetical protein
MALSALRGIAQTAFNLNCLEADTLARIRAVKRVSGDNQRKGRALSRKRFVHLFRPLNGIRSVSAVVVMSPL